MTIVPYRRDPRDPNDWGDPYDKPAPPECHIEFTVTDNPVIAELLDACGVAIRQWRERPPFGFQPPTTSEPK